MSNIKVKGISRKKIGILVRLIRKKFNIEYKVNIDIIRFLEYVMGEILEYNIEYLSIEDMTDCDGKSYPDKKLIQIREEVYIQALNGDNRARHTIAHEIGHALLHNENAYARVDKDYIVPKYEDPEWQASAFAGELLAPSYLIGDRDIDKIMEDFGVSRGCAEIQYKNKSKVLGE